MAWLSYDAAAAADVAGVPKSSLEGETSIMVDAFAYCCSDE